MFNFWNSPFRRNPPLCGFKKIFFIGFFNVIEWKILCFWKMHPFIQPIIKSFDHIFWFRVWHFYGLIPFWIWKISSFGVNFTLIFENELFSFWVCWKFTPCEVNFFCYWQIIFSFLILIIFLSKQRCLTVWQVWKLFFRCWRFNFIF